MADKDSASSTQPTEFEEIIKQRRQVFGTLLEKLKPWLFEFGNWLFGGLIALNLVVISALLTVGPVDAATTIASAAFACALPLNVVGLLLLKLIKDITDAPFDDVLKKAFEDANFSDVDVYFNASESKDDVYKRRTDVGLRYSMTLASISALLTILGLMMALWHMAWWVAVLFVVVIIASLAVATVAFSQLMPPDTEAEKQMKQRYRDERSRQNRKPTNAQ